MRCPKAGNIKRDGGANHGNQGNNLCQEFGKRCGRVCLVNNHGGGDGSVGESVPWCLSDGCRGAEGLQSAPRFEGLR